VLDRWKERKGEPLPPNTDTTPGYRTLGSKLAKDYHSGRGLRHGSPYQREYQCFTPRRAHELEINQQVRKQRRSRLGEALPADPEARPAYREIGETGKDLCNGGVLRNSSPYTRDYLSFSPRPRRRLELEINKEALQAWKSRKGEPLPDDRDRTPAYRELGEDGIDLNNGRSTSGRKQHYQQEFVRFAPERPLKLDVDYRALEQLMEAGSVV